MCTIPVWTDNIAEVMKPTVTMRKKKDERKEVNSPIETSASIASTEQAESLKWNNKIYSNSINNYHKVNSKDMNILGNPMKTIPTNQGKRKELMK